MYTGCRPGPGLFTQRPGHFTIHGTSFGVGVTPLEAAQGQLGYVEQGGADGRSGNITSFWQWWLEQTGENDQGASWCGCFVSWCFDQAGARFTIDSRPGFIYCPSGENWFRSQGLLVDAAHAQPGDVAFFHFIGEANEANHTGIVESVDPANQTITCIEGNTSSGTAGNQSNGGGVYRRTRPWPSVRSIGHASWVKPTVTPPAIAPVTAEELLLMAIAQDDDDARRTWVRANCLTLWGQEPTGEEQNILVYACATTGADVTLAHIADHPHAAALRAKRGW